MSIIIFIVNENQIENINAQNDKKNNKNIRNDACSFSVSVNSDSPVMSTEFPTVNITNK